MGKKFIISLVVIGGLAVNAAAHELPMPPVDCFPPPPPDCRQYPPIPPPDHHCGKPMMPLNATQQVQLDQLLHKEHDYVAGLMKKLHENRQSLRLAADRELFDEAAVRDLVKQQAELQAELMLSHIRTKIRIKALLQPAPKD